MTKIRHSVLLTTSCIVFNKWKILLIKYGKNKWEREGICNWIWWHIEAGEWIIQSAKREIKEESWLDLEVRLKWIIHTTNFFGKDYMMYITVSYSDTNIVTNNEEWELFRADPKDLNNYKIFENVKMFVDYISQTWENEVFTAKNIYDWWWKLLKFEIE